MQAESTYSLFGTHTQSTRTISSHVYNCQLQSFITLAVPPLVVAILVVIYEFIVYPLFSRYTLRMVKRMALGIAICLIGVLVLLILNGVAHLQYSYATCMFYSVLPNWDQRYHISGAWLVLPIVLMGIGEFFLFITGAQFMINCMQLTHVTLNIV